MIEIPAGAGDRPLLRAADGTRLLSYAELADRAGRLAAALEARGVGEAGVVAVRLPPGPAFVTAAAACARIGAVLCPIAPGLTEVELARVLDLCRPRALLAHEPPPGGPPELLGLLAGDGRPPDWRHGPTPAAPERPEPAPRPGDALLLLTSGSTAAPKAVVLTRANVAAGVAAVRTGFGLDAGDQTLALLPWTHGHGLLGVLAATAAAGASVRLGLQGDAVASARAIAAGGVTWVSVVPPLLALLTEAAARVPAAAGRLRFVRTASAPLPAAIATRAEAVFGCPVAEAYGMTETSHQAAANPPDSRRRLGTVGLPTGTEWRLAGPELAGGRLLEVRGPGVFRAYLGDLERTEGALLPGGWYRTQDVGAIEEDGHIRLLARRSELINRGGFKVAPLEVEEAALAHPAVAQCLAAAVPHPLLGEEVGLLVVARPGASLEASDLRRFCAGRLAGDKRPGVIRLVAALPALPNGKPSRTLAARLLAGEREGGVVD